MSSICARSHLVGQLQSKSDKNLKSSSFAFLIRFFKLRSERSVSSQLIKSSTFTILSIEG